MNLTKKGTWRKGRNGPVGPSAGCAGTEETKHKRKAGNMKRETHFSKYDGKPFVHREYDRSALDQMRMVARECYAWPGGYAMFALMENGDAMCPSCIKRNYRQLFASTKSNDISGWCVIGIDALCNCEEAPICCECSKEIA